MNTRAEETNCMMITGLGNPGAEYDGTRHNAGFAVVDAVMAKIPRAFEMVHGCSSHYWRGSYAGRPLYLQKPETFMNLSGAAVGSLMNKAGLTPENVLIIYDDMDMPLGRIRIRRDGGSGGHNGIKSIVETIGTEKFPRIRIGIGHGANGEHGKDYVLSGFDAKEKPLFDKAISGAADAVILLLRRGIGMAMNQYNAVDYSATEEVSDKATETNEQKHVEQTIKHQEV